MMQAANPGHLNYPPAIGRLHWPGDRAVVDELMAQRQEFEGEIVPTLEEGKRLGQNDPESG